MYNEQAFTKQLLKTIDDILGGKRASDIPFYEPQEAHPTFNYTRLINKGLDPKRCPDDTIFYDKPVHFLNKYKWFITIFLLRIRHSRTINSFAERSISFPALVTFLVSRSRIRSAIFS